MIEAIAFVVMLLFADNRDAATAMSESCGGGGGSSLESGCDKKNDEDGWKVAHSSVQMTHSMCKPKPRHRGFHR